MVLLIFAKKLKFSTMSFTFQPIGILHTPFHDPAGMPIQPSGESAAQGTAEIFPEFAAGLKDLAGFSHIILVYVFHRQTKKSLTVTPFLDDAEHGVFATRAPSRPNPIGISVVPLMKVEGNVLTLDQLDMLDRTPLLDIKPFVPDFDGYENVKTGWLANNKAGGKNSDGRFLK